MSGNWTTLGARSRSGIQKALLAAMLLSGSSLLASNAAVAQEEVVARVALASGIDYLDPARTSSGPSWTIIFGVYETLLEIDTPTGELRPKLAQSFKAIKPTVWEIVLREGVKFHDGSPLTSADVKYSIERILDKDLASPHASQIATITEVRVIDDLTVHIVTSVPDPVLMRRMQPVGGSGRVYIVPKGYFESRSLEEVNDKPVGTGPYKLESWVKGTSVTLTRNDDYWGEAPDIDKGIFTFIPENSTRVNALLQGEVDIIQRLPIVDVERVDNAPETYVVSSPNGHIHTLQLNATKPPFSDIELRKAFAHALDTEEMVSALLGDYGRVLAVPMTPNSNQYNDAIKPYTYDPDLSRSILEKKPVGKLHTFTSNGRYVNDRDFYDVINQQLEQVGFDIEPQPMEWGRLVTMMMGGTAGPFYFIGWDFGEGDASKMNSFLHTGTSFSVVADPEYDRLVALAGKEIDETERAKIWKEVQQYVHDQYYIAAIWQASALYGFSKKFSLDDDLGENLMIGKIKVSKK